MYTTNLFHERHNQSILSCGWSSTLERCRLGSFTSASEVGKGTCTNLDPQSCFFKGGMVHPQVFGTALSSSQVMLLSRIVGISSGKRMNNCRVPAVVDGVGVDVFFKSAKGTRLHPIRSCRDFPGSGPRTAWIRPHPSVPSFEVLCDNDRTLVALSNSFEAPAMSPLPQINVS